MNFHSFIIRIPMSVRLLTSCFVCLQYFIGLYSAVCIFTSVISGILTYPAVSIQDADYPDLNWKPDTTFMALESRMSAVSV